MAFEIKTFDKRAQMVFLLPVEYEKHVCPNAEAHADQWTHVHLDACLPAFWHRGSEVLIKRTNFEKPAIASQSRVFRFLTQTKRKKKT
jgi:hypothetical protein